MLNFAYQTNFQKNEIGWPQQPPTEKMLISMKNWIFEGTFHKNGPELVILVPGISKFFDEILRVMVRLMRLQRLMSLIRPQRF